MKPTPRLSDLAREIRRLVAERPNFIYPRAPSQRNGLQNFSCSYNGNEQYQQPPCIFGQAFINLGHPIPAQFEGTPISAILQRMLVDGRSLTDSDLSWAEKLQTKQDTGNPWADALDAADATRKSQEEAFQRRIEHTKWNTTLNVTESTTFSKTGVIAGNVKPVPKEDQ